MRKEKTRGKGSHLFVGSLAGFHPQGFIFAKAFVDVLYACVKGNRGKKISPKYLDHSPG